MRASTLLLVVTALTGCQLNKHFNQLDDYPLTWGSDSASMPDDSVSGSGDVLPTTTFGPIATVTGPDATEGEPGQVLIVDVMLPADATSAGPLPLAVKTENATKVEVTVDAGEPWVMMEGESEMWSFGIPVLGAIDEGPHDVEIVATGATGEAKWTGGFVVTVPDPGKQAWAESIKAPAGVTRALAILPTGDVIEAGATSVDGAMRVAVRRRSAEDGKPAWAGETIVLWPELEGEAEGVASRRDAGLRRPPSPVERRGGRYSGTVAQAQNSRALSVASSKNGLQTGSQMLA